MKRLLLPAIALGALVTISAQAVTTANLWKLADVDTYIDTPAFVPGTTPDVTFNVNKIDFTYAVNPTVVSFIASSGAYNITENTANTLASQASDGSIGTLIDIKGCVSVEHGQTIWITHDDGVFLSINGVDQGFFSGPTSPLYEAVTYTGPTGIFPFEIVYGENHAGEAVLTSNLKLVNCPDGGSTLALLGGVFSLMGLVSRRFRK